DDIWFRLFRREANSFIEMGHRLRELLESIEENAQMNMAVGKLWVQMNIIAIGFHRLWEVLGFFIQVPQVISHFKFSRLGLQNFRQLVDRLCKLLLLSINQRHA